MKYNLRKIMLKAWELFRKLSINFAEALHRACSVTIDVRLRKQLKKRLSLLE